MKKNLIGIDISKDSLDFCVLDSSTFELKQKGLVNNHRKAIDRWLKHIPEETTLFALEHTGHYGAMIAHCLTERGFDYYLINPLDLKKSLGIQRGKTDQKDALRIAQYALKNRYKLKIYELPAVNLRKLKALTTARDRYVKISVQLQNSLKASQILSKTTDIDMLLREEKKQLANIKKCITRIEKEIESVIRSDNSLLENYTKIQSVIGVGPIVAVKCIVATDNFLKFENARKFSCHCGLAPFPYQSGTSIRGKTKTHHLRVKSLKATLIKSATTAIQYDPQLKKYYDRKTKEGKHKMSVKKCRS
jgi:transposase